jgi:EF-P beta-lysylation protein EpmB
VAHYNELLLAYESLTSMPPTWQAEMAESFTDPLALLRFLGLNPDAYREGLDAERLFPFRVTRHYARQIRQGHINDPLLRQVLPVGAEKLEYPGYGADPVGDLASISTPGLLHKYAGRALLITTGACAIHCRYCFRREFPYDTNLLARSRESEVLAAIAADTSLHEIILSGGDPLVLGDDRLSQLIAGLATIPHLKRLRLHSRLPVVLPNRITPELTATLSQSRLDSVLVIHANHAQELDVEVQNALTRLRDSGVLLLNQAVLLRGVNDDALSLAALSERLFECGTLPYYLHMLDRARGTAHFEVSDERARQLMTTLRESLPGYLVPKLVREEPGAPGKTPIF